MARYELYHVAIESEKEAENIKSSILLTYIGQEAREIYNTFTITDPADSMKVGPVLEKFTKYCNPRKNVTCQSLSVLSLFFLKKVIYRKYLVSVFHL